MQGQPKALKMLERENCSECLPGIESATGESRERRIVWGLRLVQSRDMLTKQESRGKAL